jgi:hypothetical protein
LLLNFIGQVVKFGTPFQREAGYAIAQAIVIHNPESEFDFAAIGSCATLDTDLHPSPIVKGLLRVLVERGIVVRRATRLPAGKQWSMFPAIDVDFEVWQWQPPEGDIFEGYEKWPPIHMIDPGFAGSAVLKEAKNAISKIRTVRPLSDWSEKVDLARRQEQNAEGRSRTIWEMPSTNKVKSFLSHTQWA